MRPYIVAPAARFLLLAASMANTRDWLAHGVEVPPGMSMMDHTALDEHWDCEFDTWERYKGAHQRKSLNVAPPPALGGRDSQQKRWGMADAEIPRNCINLDAFSQPDPNAPAGSGEAPENLADCFHVPMHLVTVNYVKENLM